MLLKKLHSSLCDSFLFSRFCLSFFLLICLIMQHDFSCFLSQRQSAFKAAFHLGQKADGRGMQAARLLPCFSFCL